MTVNDPRPALAATLAARLAPAAEALASACAEDASPEPPPPDDRACAEHHRAVRARLHHLRQLLPLLDWSARHLPEPEPQPEPVEEPWEPPPPILSDYDGSRDECHRGDRKHVGRLNTPEYRAWEERQRRRDEREEREEEEAEALAARARGGGDGDRKEHDIS